MPWFGFGLAASLRGAGFGTERRDETDGLADIFEGMGEGLAEWIVTGPSGEQMMLQLAYFDRTRQPVLMDIGPVLDLEDVVGGKVCALASRAEPRDYLDTGAALRRYSVEQVIRFVLEGWKFEPCLWEVDPGAPQRPQHSGLPSVQG